MGRPKLLLPWDGATVIQRVLATWRASGVTHTVVTVHPGDESLADLCRRSGADVVAPAEPPADMKTSVQLALTHVQRQYQPHAHDAWLLAPADMPGLQAADIARVLQAYCNLLSPSGEPRIVAPVFGGRRGHPVAFPWSLAADVERLTAAEGINRLVAGRSVLEIECPDRSILDDLDTAADYQRLRSTPARPRSHDSTSDVNGPE
jgi:molybdenum cofactor cytidylyltransferase